MSFQSKNTPILAAEFGFQFINTGEIMLLSAACPSGIPRNARAAWLQAVGGNTIRYVLNGDIATDLEAYLVLPSPGILRLTNREQLEGCVIDGARAHVQFFSSDIGLLEDTW